MRIFHDYRVNVSNFTPFPLAHPFSTSSFIPFAFSLSFLSTSTQQYEFLFSRFAEQYGKHYDLSSFFTKYNTFRSNLDAVLAHNKNGNSTFTLAINEFGDLTQEEFQKTILKLRPAQNLYARSFNVGDHSNITLTAEESMDWREKGGVTRVKNQGQCGSCWAFAAVVSMEAAHFVKTNKLVDLSEQQLVDCAGSYGNNACNGGGLAEAFEYVVGNGGICTESSYPYAGKKQNCKSSCKLGTRLKGYRNVRPRDEVEMAKATKVAPLTVAIQANDINFQFYSSGVFDSRCGTNLDHGVTIVGFGTDRGKDYWAVKNSWGASWGENGYIRMARGKNQCGISQLPSYAVV